MLEAVPNFSDSRPEVVDALCDAVTATGAQLLDRHSDPDHNRSVLTLAGPAETVAEAAFGAATVAVERIDLTEHRGAHPRMGAVDVIPFVPLDWIDNRAGDDAGGGLSEAAEIARQVGARIGAELGVPVYLYGAAAAPGSAADLRTIRGDGFEALLAIGEGLPPPDFGPSRLHPTAGAVAVGARMPLVAFNVILSNSRLAVARRIAARIRESSGGLPEVQAIGIWLDEREAAQVSMNLLDYRETGIAKVLGHLRTAADEEGVELKSAELVGLAPAEALTGLADDPLPGMPGMGQSIEARLT